MRTVLAVLAAGVVLYPTRLSASHVPTHMTIQGKLTDASGIPLPAGSKTLTFRIFDAPTTGTKIWPGGPGEVQTITTGSDGLWIALVGALAPLTDSVFADTARWLEIEVNDGINPPVVLPRTCLVTGPFAFRVATVDGAAGGTITSKVSIGEGHTNTGDHAFIAGHENSAGGHIATVGGGVNNVAGGDTATICGGSGNHAEGPLSVIAGGSSNWATGIAAAVVGGQKNLASGNDALVAGLADTASGSQSVVSGGQGNVASGSESVVSGGVENRAEGDQSLVAGGLHNRAMGNGATVGGGWYNLATGSSSVVSGGNRDTALSLYTVVAGGSYNTANLAGSTVGGGDHNRADGTYSTVAGGTRDTAGGLIATVGGGKHNVANGDTATICGGTGNRADGILSVIAGGNNNRASAISTAVGGGEANRAGGSYSVVIGGMNDTASGLFAAVLGGSRNVASGINSLAAGRQARAVHDGAFVWADNRNAAAPSIQTNEFVVRAENGFRLTDTAGSAEVIDKGVYFRDNAIVAWAKVTAAGATLGHDFGISSVTHSSVGDYTIVVDADAIITDDLIAVATVEIDNPPTTALTARHIYVNQTGLSTFHVYITNGNHAAYDNDFIVMVTAR